MFTCTASFTALYSWYSCIISAFRSAAVWTGFPFKMFSNLFFSCFNWSSSIVIYTMKIQKNLGAKNLEISIKHLARAIFFGWNFQISNKLLFFLHVKCCSVHHLFSFIVLKSYQLRIGIFTIITSITSLVIPIPQKRGYNSIDVWGTPLFIILFSDFSDFFRCCILDKIYSKT